MEHTYPNTARQPLRPNESFDERNALNRGFGLTGTYVSQLTGRNLSQTVSEKPFQMKSPSLEGTAELFSARQEKSEMQEYLKLRRLYSKELEANRLLKEETAVCREELKQATK